MKRHGLLLIVIAVLLNLGCATTRLPPSRPLPIEAIEMVYTPADSKTYSSTASDPYPPFKMTWALANTPAKINRNEKIVRPYITIGTMVFKSNWYDDETIAKLIRLYVPQKGGDAVSSYHMAQEAAAMMKDPDTGKFRTYYRGTIHLEIIRYVDKQGQ